MSSPIVRSSRWPRTRPRSASYQGFTAPQPLKKARMSYPLGSREAALYGRGMRIGLTARRGSRRCKNLANIQCQRLITTAWHSMATMIKLGRKSGRVYLSRVAMRPVILTTRSASTIVASSLQSLVSTAQGILMYRATSLYDDLLVGLRSRPPVADPLTLYGKQSGWEEVCCRGSKNF